MPASWLWISNLLYLLVLGVALRRAEWGRLRAYRSLQHCLGAAVVSLVLLWQLRAGVMPGLDIHFLGLTALTLVMGWAFAVIAASLALLVTTVVGQEAYEPFAFSAPISCVVPIGISYGVYRVERLLGFRLFFAYIFIGAFFGGALAIVGVALVTALLLWLGEVYSAQEIAHNYLTYLPLMAFPEGVINGIVITGLMVFLPQYLKTLERQRYDWRR